MNRISSPGSRTPRDWVEFILIGTAAALVTVGAVVEPILLSVAAVCVLLLAVASRVRRTRMGWLAPIPLLAVGIVIYLIPLPLTVRFGGLVTHLRFDDVTRGAVETATLLHALGLIALVAGERLSRPLPILRGGVGWRRDWPTLPAVVVALAVIVAGTASSMILLRTVGGAGALTGEAYAQRYLLTRGLGPLMALSRAVGIGALILYALGIKRSSRVLQVAGLCTIVGFFGGWLVLFQQRRPFFQALIALLVVRQAMGKALRYKMLAGLAIALFAGSVVVGVWRAGVSSSVIDFFLDYPHLLNPANMEMGAPILTTAHITGIVPDYHPFEMGESYLKVPLGMVPRVVWPERPHGTAEWYAQTFYPDVWSQGGAFAFSPAAEAFLNFGLIGVIVVFGIIGLLGGWVGRWLNEVGRVSPIIALTYGFSASWLLIFSRLDGLSLVKGFSVTLGPLVLAHLAIWVVWLILMATRRTGPGRDSVPAKAP